MHPALAIQDRQKRRRELTAFASLIETPGDLVAGITLPASAKLYASVAAAMADNGPLVTVSDTIVNGTAGASGELHSLGHHERDKQVVKAAGAAGVVTLYVSDGFGKPLKIAEG